MPIWAGQGDEGPMERSCLFPLPISPHREKQPLKQLLLSLKMLFISFFITGTYVLTFANMNQFTFMQKKAQSIAHFFVQHNKDTPTPTPTLPSDISLVKLSHWDMLLSAHSPLWKGFLCPPSAASVQLQGIFQPAMCIRWSRAQGTMLSPTLVGHHG